MSSLVTRFRPGEQDHPKAGVLPEKGLALVAGDNGPMCAGDAKTELRQVVVAFTAKRAVLRTANTGTLR